MAQRHTVYLKRSAENVTPEQVLASITDIEWDLVAESCGVPFARIDEADENLRIVNDMPPGFRCYKLYYRPGDQRPVDVDRWQSLDEAAGVIQEVIDDLDRKTRWYARVSSFLKECVDSVSASYGSAPGEEMAPILGSQVCLWLAQQFDGIIRDPCGDWYEPADADGLDLKLF